MCAMTSRGSISSRLLDVRACVIHQKMLIAAVPALAGLARLPVPEEALTAYNLAQIAFGHDYKVHCTNNGAWIIPKPLDPRLLATVPPAAARAAIAAGVARAPYPAHYPA
jgi:malate dehydrogenase (oxaloacetate-decarboxylating)(NADP+)